MQKINIKNFLQALNSHPNSIKIMLITGILIRIILMPLFAHPDLISTYTRAYNVAFEGVHLFTYGQPLSHLIETVNLWIYSIFVNPDNIAPVTLSRSENSITNLNLFVFKLSYLLFDLAAFYIISLLLSGNKNKNLALAFYFLNPIMIFAVYMFSRYETFPIFFTLMSLLFLQQKRELLSASAIGLAILTRPSFVLLIPVYAALNGKNWILKVLMSIITMLPYASILIYKSSFLNIANETRWLTEGTHQDFVFNMTISTGGGFNIYIFITAYLLLLYFAFKSWLEKHESNWKKNNYYFLMTFGLFYSFAHFHPQYLAWVMPFLGISLAYFHRNMIKNIIIVFIALFGSYFLYMLNFGQDIFMQIFTPISDEIGRKNLSGVINNYYDYKKLANIGRSGITASFFLIMGYAFASYHRIPSMKKILKRLK